MHGYGYGIPPENTSEKLEWILFPTLKLLKILHLSNPLPPERSDRGGGLQQIDPKPAEPKAEESILEEIDEQLVI